MPKDLQSNMACCKLYLYLVCVQDLVAYWPTAASQLPIVYHEKYNVSFFGG
jgi:hypothetical protein